jgi:uncharacterized protein (DUF1800 family)
MRVEALWTITRAAIAAGLTAVMLFHWHVEEAKAEPLAIVATSSTAAPAENIFFAERIPTYTEEDLEILTRVLTGECQTGTWELQIAVGSVVLNRVAHEAYPNTIKGVVFQRGQYACTWDGNYYRTPTELNREAARWLLTYGSQLPTNVVYQAQFRQGRGVWKRIGSEIFCYR